MLETLVDNAPSCAMVKMWGADFKRGQTSIEDAVRSGRPSTACTDQNVQKVQYILMADRCVT